jgi:pSer/pThr/pTyr-binding forkhead associated (FHA) protein
VLLYVLEGPDAGKKFLLRRLSTILGRGKNADLQIHDAAVSRAHCQIMVSNQGVLGIKDLASKNGTWVNGRTINAVKINPNDVFQIGDTKIRIMVMEHAL